MTQKYLESEAGFNRGGCESPVFHMKAKEFEQFRTLVHEQAGIWLRDGKQVMLASRLSRRLRRYGLASFTEYYRYIQSLSDNTAELREMINCVTTNKTSFFRENHHFEYLKNTIAPEILAENGGTTPRIRIWSAACSTGEEPYSIAMTLLDALAERRVSASGRRTVATIEILASDIDTAVLETAKRGVYADTALNAIDAAMAKRYLLRGKDKMSGMVKIKSEVARLVEFKRINLKDGSWPVEGPLDAIFFRNALIYFKQDMQESFLRRMARYLKPGGYLLLGSSEHIPWLSDLYRPLQQTMYQLKGGAQ